MGKTNARIDAVRKEYREALEAARTNPTPEAWARLLAAGKDLSALHESRSRGRHSRRSGTPSYRELEGSTPPQDAPDVERFD